VTVNLTVTGSYDSSLGNRRGRPDTWEEAWTELDIDSISNEQGCPLPTNICGKVRADDSFVRAVWRHIGEQ
jgi:hypothetical protein